MTVQPPHSSPQATRYFKPKTFDNHVLMHFICCSSFAGTILLYPWMVWFPVGCNRPKQVFVLRLYTNKVTFTFNSKINSMFYFNLIQPLGL